MPAFGVFAPTSLVKTVIVENELLSEPITLKVDLAKLGSEAVADAMTTTAQDPRLLAKIIEDVVIEWDITETDDGPPLPITTAGALRLPYALLVIVASKVLEAYQPGEASSGA